jgi:hypothetical protein
MNKQQFLTTLIIGLALYLIATGISFAGFSYLGKSSKPAVTVTTTANGTQQHFTIDPSVPRNEVCPINGKMYTTQEKDAWSKNRPIAVMIENHTEARPQSGLSSADVVYESVAEGGITRFMGVFYCGIALNSTNFAPVRSARVYFLPWVLEYDALYNHVGGAGCDGTVDPRAKALCQIEDLGIKDMDEFNLGIKTKDKKQFLCYKNPDRLDHEVATEHTMICTSGGLYNEAALRGWTNVDAKGVSWDKNFQPWKFADDAKESARGSATSIKFTAWQSEDALANYSVRWDYDKAANVYKRFTAGAPHLDLETKTQLNAKVVAVLFAKETRTGDEHGHLLYNNVGSGDAIIFQNGTATKAVWQKPTKTSRTVFYDASTNKEMVLTRGQIWIEMLPIGTAVTY